MYLLSYKEIVRKEKISEEKNNSILSSVSTESEEEIVTEKSPLLTDEKRRPHC